MPTLTLYGKPGCHLCEDARAIVERVCAGRDVVLEEVDITLGPTLHARYGERIPVLLLDGEPVFELIADPAALQQALDRVGA